MTKGLSDNATVLDLFHGSVDHVDHFNGNAPALKLDLCVFHCGEVFGDVCGLILFHLDFLFHFPFFFCGEFRNIVEEVIEELLDCYIGEPTPWSFQLGNPDWIHTCLKLL